MPGHTSCRTAIKVSVRARPRELAASVTQWPSQSLPEARLTLNAVVGLCRSHERTEGTETEEETALQVRTPCASRVEGVLHPSPCPGAWTPVLVCLFRLD